jgi:hypothetical protein
VQPLPNLDCPTSESDRRLATYRLTCIGGQPRFDGGTWKRYDRRSRQGDRSGTAWEPRRRRGGPRDAPVLRGHGRVRILSKRKWPIHTGVGEP